jgi:polar amino acid transport system substrate-binding protein
MSCKKEKDENILVVGLSADYPPFEYREGNEIKGFDVDLAKFIAKELGKTVEFKDMTFASLFSALNAGQIDAIISMAVETPERAQNFSFSSPYFFDKLAVVYRTDHPVKTLEDLQSQKVGSQLGSVQEIWVKTHCTQSQSMTMDNTAHLIEALKSKHLNAVIIDLSQAAAYCNKNVMLGYSIIGEAGGNCVVLKKGSSLLSVINAALKTLKEKGSLSELEKKWVHNNQ